jgi:hypothetical protein
VFSGTKVASRSNSLNPSKSVVRFHIDFERDPGVSINQSPIVEYPVPSFKDWSKLPETYQEAISFYLNENPTLDSCGINDIIADVLSLRQSTSLIDEQNLVCNSLVLNMETSTMITYEEKMLTFRPYEQQEGNSIYLNFFLEDVQGDGTHSKLLFKTFENRFEMWSVLKDLLFQFQESEVNNWLKTSRSKIMPETGFEIPKSNRTGVEAEVVSIVVSLDSTTLTDFVAQLKISRRGTDERDNNQHCMVHGPVHSDRNVVVGDKIPAFFNLKNGKNNFEVEHSDGRELLSFNLVCDGTETERVYQVPESNLQGTYNESFFFFYSVIISSRSVVETSVRKTNKFSTLWYGEIYVKSNKTSQEVNVEIGFNGITIHQIPSALSTITALQNYEEVHLFWGEITTAMVTSSILSIEFQLRGLPLELFITNCPSKRLLAIIHQRGYLFTQFRSYFNGDCIENKKTHINRLIHFYQKIQKWNSTDHAANLLGQLRIHSNDDAKRTNGTAEDEDEEEEEIEAENEFFESLLLHHDHDASRTNKVLISLRVHLYLLHALFLPVPSMVGKIAVPYDESSIKEQIVTKMGSCSQIDFGRGTVIWIKTCEARILELLKCFESQVLLLFIDRMKNNLLKTNFHDYLTMVANEYSLEIVNCMGTLYLNSFQKEFLSKEDMNLAEVYYYRYLQRFLLLILVSPHLFFILESCVV